MRLFLVKFTHITIKNIKCTVIIFIGDVGNYLRNIPLNSYKNIFVTFRVVRFGPVLFVHSEK